MNDKMLDGFTAPLIDKYPNTYTFTKSLAEYLIEKESVNLPFMNTLLQTAFSAILPTGNEEHFPIATRFIYDRQPNNNLIFKRFFL